MSRFIAEPNPDKPWKFQVRDSLGLWDTEHFGGNHGWKHAKRRAGELNYLTPEEQVPAPSGATEPNKILRFRKRRWHK